jgi:drug/metabolite transporter (DMT)-like permease
MIMNKPKLRWYFALVVAAALWGISFAPSRSAMEHTGPLTFNAIRFGLGGVLVGILGGMYRWRSITFYDLRIMFALGMLLFLGAALQQIGLVTTSAGQGGFITGLYIVITPVFLWSIWKESIPRNCWLGVIVALLGLGLLTLQPGLVISTGDLWVLACAVVFALHVIGVGRYGKRTDPITLSVGQYLVCSVTTGIGAAIFEQHTWPTTGEAWPELLYMVVASIGIAYTLQMMAQRHVPVATAALIMSLEGVFAALGGWWLLGESLAPRQLLGGALMIAGILIAQLHEFKRQPSA